MTHPQTTTSIFTPKPAPKGWERQLDYKEPNGHSFAVYTKILEPRNGNQNTEILAQEMNHCAKKIDVSAGTGGGHKALYGGAADMTPLTSASSDWTSLDSIKAMRGEHRSSITIGFDTEYFENNGEREILSYQSVTRFADTDSDIGIVVIPLQRGTRITFKGYLEILVDSGQLWRNLLMSEDFTRCDVGLSGVHESVVDGLDYELRRKVLGDYTYKLTIITHYGLADLTTFFRSPSNRFDILRHVTNASKGLGSRLPIRYDFRNSRARHYWLPFSISIRDSIASAPAGKHSLKDLGDTCGIPKIEIGAHIEDMSKFRENNFAEFLEYSINDAVICREYLAYLWGADSTGPMTLPSAASRVFVRKGCEYFGTDSASEFREVFAGNTPEKGADFLPIDGDELDFLDAVGRVPIDSDAQLFQEACSHAFHGGLNDCEAPGWWGIPTVDIDLENAYPTALSAIYDLDWGDGEEGAGVIDTVIRQRELSLADFPLGPLTPMAAFVTFEFPDSVNHPCIPVVIGESLIYPRSSEGLSGVWVMGPELYLAMKLGARLYCQNGYIARTRKDSRVNRFVFEGLVADRREAQFLHGKKSLPDLVIKTASNSLYGKQAQDVKPKRAWDSRVQDRSSIGGSAISSPYHASMATSYVRALLCAIPERLNELGLRVYSRTTDGFISDAPDLDISNESSLDKLVGLMNALDLYGFEESLKETRLALSGSSVFLDFKHYQSKFLNVSTRCNIAPPDAGKGVLAHGGLKLPAHITKDSNEDRNWMIDNIISRTDGVISEKKDPPSFEELTRLKNRKDFTLEAKHARMSMNYDFKREPVWATFEIVDVEDSKGELHEFARFRTKPWKNVDNFLHAKRIAKDMKCLRTKGEWDEFRARLTSAGRYRIGNFKDAKLRSILQAHRLGVVKIPTLASRELSVQEKLEWVGSFGLGMPTESQWKNARKQGRRDSMLPLEMLEPELSAMCSVEPENQVVSKKS